MHNKHNDPCGCGHSNRTNSLGVINYSAQSINELLAIIPLKANRNEVPAPDEEDLTIEKGLLKLKDKKYNHYNYSGLGRCYLRKNMVDGVNVLTQEMFFNTDGSPKKNTRYIIQYDYVLNHATLQIPEGCELSFEGGSIKNGTIVLNETLVRPLGCRIGDYISAIIEGTYKKGQVLYSDEYEQSAVWTGDKWKYSYSTIFRNYENKLQYSVDEGKTWEYCSDYIAHYFRYYNNKIQISHDKLNWEDLSDEIAAYFRFQAIPGGERPESVGKIQISRDNKIWTDLSPEFTNHIRIAGYVAEYANLPTNKPAGTIIGVGPTTDEKGNKLYRFYVYDGNSWVDNGQFTSIAAGIVQEMGDSENVVMSQKVVSENLSKLHSEVSKLILGEIPSTPNYIIGYTIDNSGNLIESPSNSVSDFIDLKGNTDIGVYVSQNSNGRIVEYDKDKNFIDYYGNPSYRRITVDEGTYYIRVVSGLNPEGNTRVVLSNDSDVFWYARTTEEINIHDKFAEADAKFRKEQTIVDSRIDMLESGFVRGSSNYEVGYSIDTETGLAVESAANSISGFINLNGETYIDVNVTPDIVGIVAIYDENLNYISYYTIPSSRLIDLSTVSPKVKYVRVVSGINPIGNTSIINSDKFELWTASDSRNINMFDEFDKNRKTTDVVGFPKYINKDIVWKEGYRNIFGNVDATDLWRMTEPIHMKAGEILNMSVQTVVSSVCYCCLVDENGKYIKTISTNESNIYYMADSDCYIELSVYASDVVKPLFIESKLSQKVSELESRMLTKAELQEEVTRATSAEKALDESIKKEVNRATNAELELRNSISSEVTRAKDAEAKLDSKVSNQLNEQNKELVEFKKTITDQIKDYNPIEINGNVTNAADEEDLTSDENNLLKLKDRNNLDGMGRIILRKSKSFAEQLVQTNTVYEIRYDFDLNEGEVTVPEGCVLDFQGGKLSNGVLNGNNTIISSQLVKVFDNVVLGGTYSGSGYPEWFGTIADKRSFCLIESMTLLYNVYNHIELQEGTYYAHSGKSVQCRSLEGKGRMTVIDVTGYTNDYTPFVLGKLGGKPTERTANQIIRGLRIEMKESNILRTSCLTLGAITRCLIDNITCWNFAERNTEFTATELENPEEYCNYGIVINGAIELTSMTNFSIGGDIGVYLKTSTDVFTMSNGYIEVSDFGFSGMYGRPLGTNSSLTNTDIAVGLYGLHFKTTTYDQGRFLVKNVRIEQLRKLYIDGNVIGCNVYIDGSTGNLTPSYIENLGLSATTNGFHLKGIVNLSIAKAYGTAGDSQNEFDFKIEGNAVNLSITEYNAAINGGFDLPEGYALEGLDSIQLNGNPYYKPKAGNKTRIYYPGSYVFDNRFTSINKYLYKRQYCKDISEGYSSFAIFNSRVQQNIVLCKIAVTIFDNDKYSSATYVVKFKQDENGTQTGVISSLKMVENLGDGIMSDEYENGKLCIVYSEGTSNVSIYNLLGKDIKSIVEFELYTKDVI